MSIWLPAAAALFVPSAFFPLVVVVEDPVPVPVFTVVVVVVVFDDPSACVVVVAVVVVHAPPVHELEVDFVELSPGAAGGAPLEESAGVVPGGVDPAELDELELELDELIQDTLTVTPFTVPSHCPGGGGCGALGGVGAGSGVAPLDPFVAFGSAVQVPPVLIDPFHTVYPLPSDPCPLYEPPAGPWRQPPLQAAVTPPCLKKYLIDVSCIDPTVGVGHGGGGGGGGGHVVNTDNPSRYTVPGGKAGFGFCCVITQLSLALPGATLE